jgi:hypothetical protein
LTASGWLVLAVFALLVGALTCISLGLWRMLDREQAEHARAMEAQHRAEGQCARMRFAAIDADARMFGLLGDLDVERATVAELRAARPTRPVAARCDLRIVR